MLVSASAIGYYGNTGDRAVDESGRQGVLVRLATSRRRGRTPPSRRATPGSASCTRAAAWSWPRRAAPGAGCSRCSGWGSAAGSATARQYWSWITLADEVRALRFLLDSELSGPVNLTSPDPVTNAEMTAAMARALHRPALLPAPAFALRAVLGEFSTEVLTSLRVVPRKLTESGFRWQHPDLASAVATLT